MTTETWEGCYDDNWRDFITPESFAHPAKFARGLVERIVSEGFTRGWWKKNDLVIDPFGGIGTGGIVCASHGLRWLGCELEPKFHALALDNFDLHRRTWEAMGDPLPRMVCGDSRRLVEVLGPLLAEGCVSSPPFTGVAQGTDGSFRDMRSEWNSDQKNAGKPGFRPNQTGNYSHNADADSYGSSPGQLGAMPTGEVTAAISSPPFTGVLQDHDTAENYAKQGCGRLGKSVGNSYGSDSANLGNLPAGDVGAVLSSPPYAETKPRQDKDYEEEKLAAAKEDGKTATRATWGHNRGSEGQQGYGDTPGNLSNLAAGAVSSPPYEGTMNTEGNGIDPTKGVLAATRPNSVKRSREKSLPTYYGDAPGNIGNDSGETFWSAARLILLQCHALLRPDAVTCWVCKNFVRKGKIVDFCGDWARLLESTGYVVTHRIRASLVKETRTPDLFSGETVKRKSRSSFFRRLYEKKHPENKIEWEEVIIAQRKESHA